MPFSFLTDLYLDAVTKICNASVKKQGTRQFSPAFEDISPTYMFYAKITYGRKYNCQL